MVHIVKLSCTLIRAAILSTNVEAEYQWPQYSSSKQASIKEIISIWLPHCVRLVQSMYSSFVKIEISTECLEMTSKLLLDLRYSAVLKCTLH